MRPENIDTMKHLKIIKTNNEHEHVLYINTTNFPLIPPSTNIGPPAPYIVHVHEYVYVIVTCSFLFLYKY